MTCRECELKLSRWLEEGWREPGLRLPAALAAHGADCPACAARVEAARRLLAGPLPPPAVPPYLAARIGARMASGTRRTRRLPRLVWASALGLATVGLFLTLRALPRPEQGAPDSPGVLVRFTLEAPQAARVAVVGDWNGWDERVHPLADPDGNGVWEAEILLLPDREYRYQFTIDGRDYVPDPGSPLRIRDGFGGMNSVLQL